VTENSNKPTQYMKFKKLGDTAAGVFVSFQEDVPSQFGKENILVLQGDEAKFVIRATTNLTRQLRQMLPSLPGKKLTITYVSDLPWKRGIPVKLYDVRPEAAQATAPVKAVA
jgi:hypothetical protein